MATIPYSHRLLFEKQVFEKKVDERAKIIKDLFDGILLEKEPQSVARNDFESGTQMHGDEKGKRQPKFQVGKSVVADWNANILTC